MDANAKLVQVRVKNVYGEEKVYPASEAAQTFAEIAGTKTLTPATMHLIRRLGYTVEVISEPVRPAWIYAGQ